MSGHTLGKCAICKADIKNYVKELQCGHQFHIGCIDDWLECTSHCPSCMGYTDSDPAESDAEVDTPNVENPKDSVVVLAGEQSNAAESNDSPIEWEEAPSSDDENNCPLCEAAMGTHMKELWCGHQFHIGCIDSWMECTSHCPSCMGYV